MTIPNKYLIYYKNEENKAINVIELLPNNKNDATELLPNNKNDETESWKVYKDSLINNTYYKFIIYGIYSNTTLTIKSNIESIYISS